MAPRKVPPDFAADLLEVFQRVISNGAIQPNQPVIKLESGSDVDISTDPSALGGNPDPRIVVEWGALDLKSRIEKQVDFFKSCPRFKSCGSPTYIAFYFSIFSTILAARNASETIRKDEMAEQNLRLLGLYFQDFLDRSRWLVREDFLRINLTDYVRCESLENLAKFLKKNSDFLHFTKDFAFAAEVGDEWTETMRFILSAKKTLRFNENILPTIHNSLIVQSSANVDGPLSLELMKMDYEFTDEIWSLWVEGCITYFERWTASPERKLPAKDFIRHLSHYQLAMELFLRHEVISEEQQSKLLQLAQNYMSLFSDHTAMKLEVKYAKLKEHVNRASIHLTEAKFWHLADDIEVLMSEPPQGISPEIWSNAVPSMLPRDKVLTAKNAVNTLYKEFQMKRYPEDEAAYLWFLTWRNIKLMLPYMTSRYNPDAIQGGADKLPSVIEARDLAVPFLDDNFPKLLAIVRKDNDALYQKEIESLVGEYCAFIDSNSPNCPVQSAFPSSTSSALKKPSSKKRPNQPTAHRWSRIALPSASTILRKALRSSVDGK
jgi:hypothetical protein